MVESTRDSVKHFNSLKCFNQSPTSSLVKNRLAFLRKSRGDWNSPPDTTFRFLLPIESPAQRVSIGEEKPICKGVFRLWRNTEFAKRVSTRWWAKMDSNHRPHDYQSCALASWAIGPYSLTSSWWRLAGSNRWPPACKAGALPAELNPQIFSHLRLLGTFLAAPSKLNNVKF